MVHLADWIVAAVAGPVLVLCCIGTFAAAIRSRRNKDQIADLRSDVNDLQIVARSVTELKADYEARKKLSDESIRRNDKDHERIFETMEANRKEQKSDLEKLQTDLIREFHKSNGTSV